jgi:hypothetical protein
VASAAADPASVEAFRGNREDFVSEQPQEPAQRFDIEIAPEVEPGVAADFATIWHTPHMFVLDFASLRTPARLIEDADTGEQVVVLPTRIVTRVKIPPEQVWELMKGLEQQLTAWKQETGRRPTGGDPGPIE